MEVHLSSQPTIVSVGNVEDLLATDPLFVDYINAFLTLPTFSEKVVFNQQDSSFEVLSEEKKILEEHVKKTAKQLLGDKEGKFSAVRAVIGSNRTGCEELSANGIDMKYTVQCVNIEQGMEWLRAERMPFFLQSELFSEYRLCKLLGQELQVEELGRPVSRKLKREPQNEVIIQEQNSRGKVSAIRRKMELERRLRVEKQEEDKRQAIEKQEQALAEVEKDADVTLPPEHALQALYVSLGDSSPAETRQWYNRVKSASQPRFKHHSSCKIMKQLKSESNSSHIGIKQPAHRIKSAREEARLPPKVSSKSDESDYTVALYSSNDEEKENAEIDRSPSKNRVRPKSGRVCIVDETETKPGVLHESVVKSCDVGNGKRRYLMKSSSSEASTGEDSVDSSPKHITKIVPANSNFQSLSVAEELKKFLKNTTGEKFWHFWIDLDRCLNSNDKPRLLRNIKLKYLNIASPLVLPLNFREENNLNHLLKFSENELKELQLQACQPLLLYWMPNFLSKKRNAFEVKLNSNVAYYHQKQIRRPTTALPTFPNPSTPKAYPLRPKSCVPYFKEVFTETRPIKKAKLRVKSAAPPQSSTNHKSNLKQRARSAQPQGLRSTSRVSFKFDENLESLSNDEDDLGIQDDDATGTDDEDDENQNDTSSYGSTIKDFAKFIQSAKMETLLRTLQNEFYKSGGVFRKYLMSAGNQKWLNCLNFWHDLQMYHQMFYDEPFDAFEIERKARAIYSLYVVATAPQAVTCHPKEIHDVRLNLEPPFEDLFDVIEEQTIQELAKPWAEMLDSDLTAYGKLEMYNVIKNLELSQEYLDALHNEGLLKSKKTPQAEVEEDERALREKSYLRYSFLIPEEFKSWTFDDLLKNRLEFEFFRRFLADNYASIDLQCWVDIESFRITAHDETEIRDTKAKDIKVKYLNKKYFFGPNSPATSKEQDKILALAGGYGKQIVPERPPNVLILECQKFVLERLQRKWLALFLATPAFHERQRKLKHMDDAADDVLMQKKRRQLQLSKLMDSKWVSSSREVIQFRKALMNPITSDQFKRYVRVVNQENFLSNDVEFWQEVQHFKDLFHNHCSDQIVNAKALLIVNCFIESILTPSLQLDITQEQADEILDKKRKPGPYIFREAQMTVFRILYPHWVEFCKFRNKMGSETKTRKTLERKSKRAQIRERKLYQRNADLEKGAERSDVGEDNNALLDNIIMSNADNMVSWKYSAYVEALEKESSLLSFENHSYLTNLSDESSIIGPSNPIAAVPGLADDKKQFRQRTASTRSKASSLTSD